MLASLSGTASRGAGRSCSRCASRTKATTAACDSSRSRSRRCTARRESRRARSRTPSTSAFGIVARTASASTRSARRFGKTVAEQRADRDHRLAARDLRLHRAALRVEVRGPGADRAAHDLLITAGVYALTGRQVTADTVAALLTILGYSIYDTIIVFDRVRENVQRMQNAAFSQIVNRSMSEVLTRSLATSFCTLLPVVALLLFGGSTLKDFAFALLVGVASGAYSSIFIASPVLTHWKEREPVYRRRRARIAAAHGGVVPALRDRRRGGARDRAAEPTGAAQRRLTPADASGRRDLDAEWVPRARARPAQRRAAAARARRCAERLRARRRVATRPPTRARGRRHARTSDRRGRAGAARRSRARSRRQRKAQLMGLLAWVMMGLALWHYTIWLPDRFWGGHRRRLRRLDRRRDRRRHRDRRSPPRRRDPGRAAPRHAPLDGALRGARRAGGDARSAYADRAARARPRGRRTRCAAPPGV